MSEHALVMAKFRERVERLQLAYRRVFGPGTATREDKLLVIADLEGVCNARGAMLRPTEHGTIYEMGKNEVWQRINNMRFPRPADARAEFRVNVERTGGLSNEQDQEGGGQGQGPAGRGVEDRTDD